MWCSWASLGRCCSTEKRKTIRGCECKTTSGRLSLSRAGKCVPPTDATSAEPQLNLSSTHNKDPWRQPWMLWLFFLGGFSVFLCHAFPMNIYVLSKDKVPTHRDSCLGSFFVVSCLRISFKLALEEKKGCNYNKTTNHSLVFNSGCVFVPLNVLPGCDGCCEAWR